MYYCSYHSTNPATAKCTHCARALCQVCDHRVKGFPFCQDCIVAGVEVLQQRTKFGAAAPPQTRSKSSPLVAGLLSVLVPGLGAAYNGQISKAVFHFALFASLFQLSSMSRAAPLFMWGMFGLWIFAIVDAYRTAQLIRSGFAPKVEEDAITRRLHSNPLAGGLVLVGLGSLILLHAVFNIDLPMREILPVALIAIGGYMVLNYTRQRQAKNASSVHRFDRHAPPPPSVVDFGAERSRLSDFTKSDVSPRPVERLPSKL